MGKQAIKKRAERDRNTKGICERRKLFMAQCLTN
jgi:hypothetical protein